MIRLDALRTFLAVIEAGNLKDAALRLSRSPAALSMTLAQIEGELGGRLFETDRKSAPTELGRFVAEQAAPLVRQHDRVIETIASFAAGRAGRLRLAVVPSVATFLLPRLLGDFLTGRPQVEVDLVDADSAQVARLVETGEAELGLCSRPGPGDPLAFAPVFADRFRLVCARSDPAATRSGPIDWAEIEAGRLILNEASRHIQAAGYRQAAARSRMTIRNMASLLAMVQGGHGQTLLPELACLSLPEGLKALPLKDQDICREVGCLTRRSVPLSPVAEAFRAHLVAAVPRVLQGLGVPVAPQRV
jgi:DNA-binding transcriptional LysR family regulator